MRFLICTLIRGYQRWISPGIHFVFGPGAGCRFVPTCSEFCYQAVTDHGVSRGVLLGIGRLCRCHPWGKSGLDPVPPPVKPLN